MRPHDQPKNPGKPPTAFYWSGERLRSRSLASLAQVGWVDVPAPPPRLVADWQRDVAQQLNLQLGDVDVLSLPRARTRWPDYQACLQAVASWAQTRGLQTELKDCDIALMACRGARYHHDGDQYGGAAFCNLFLSEDRGLDLHFVHTGQRIPLRRGTVVVFDTGQTHGVIPRGRPGFDGADFSADLDWTQVFLTWELPIEDASVAQLMQIQFDTAPSSAAQLQEEQVWRNGARCIGGP